jgi:thiol-disulfide isomerase/thioredoxin
MAMVAVWIVLFGLTGAPTDPGVDTHHVVRTFDIVDAQGNKHTTKEWIGSKAIVLFIISSECPASNGYAPEIARLSKAYADKGVVFYGIYIDPDLTAEQAAVHAKEHQLPFPMLLDPAQIVAKQTGAKRVPTAVVLSPEGNVLYRGRIDDRYVSLGKKRPEPTQRDTQDALALILEGKSPPVAETDVIGCLLPKLSALPNAKPN